jgi:hypothetical protein
MAGHSLTTASQLQCPHGGTVMIVSSNVRSRMGASLALATDQFIISGCPFQIPATPPIPSPCVTVQWMLPDQRVKVSGNPTLSQASVGICLSAAQIPQGPVSVVNTQTRGQTQ